MNDSLFTQIAALVPQGAHVLDLGCGDGSLLAQLQQQRGCTGYGIEIDDANINACIKRGVNVLQLNLHAGLSQFKDQSFDVVLQINTLQVLRNAEAMLTETTRVGRMGIIAFPNFAYWPNRWHIFNGRMPINRHLPYEWYNTPNIRVGTYADFHYLARKNHLQVMDAFGLDNGKCIRKLANLRAATAVFKLQRT